MLFSSPFFLFVFLPLALLGLLIPNGQRRLIGLLLISLAFYMWGEPQFVWMALASAYFDYLIGKRIAFLHSQTSSSRWATILLWTGIAGNLLLLIYYKYLEFFAQSVNKLLDIMDSAWHLPLLSIALPIAISFLVFEKITYLVDIYRRKSEPAPRLTLYLTYVFFFPKLLAGPIIKYHEIAPQLQTQHNAQRGNDFVVGMERFLMGVAKKVLIADVLAEVVNSIFALSGNQLGFSYAWIGVLTFTLQIYIDFSSYSDMAIGLGRMYGFRLRENFNYPYVAESFTDFWRRWHISLSTWIREYLYVPLGGNRHGTARMYANLILCFTLSGLWHGASWNFLIWGLYHGVFLVLDKLFWLRISTQLPKSFKILLTLFLVSLGWIIFRCQDMNQTLNFLTAMVTPSQDGAYIYLSPLFKFSFVIAALMVVVPMTTWYTRLSERRFVLQYAVAWSWVLASLTLLAIGKSLSISGSPFLYFRF